MITNIRINSWNLDCDMEIVCLEGDVLFGCMLRAIIECPVYFIINTLLYC